MTMPHTGSEPECISQNRVPVVRPCRKLIDYTLTNGKKNKVPTSEQEAKAGIFSSDDSRPPLRKALSSPLSAASLERRLIRDTNSSQLQEEEMIEFWLRIPSTRAPRRESRTQDVLKTFSKKTKKRSQKSTLFGSFTGNREIRRTDTNVGKDASGVSDSNYSF